MTTPDPASLAPEVVDFIMDTMFLVIRLEKENGQLREQYEALAARKLVVLRNTRTNQARRKVLRDKRLQAYKAE